MFDPKLPGMQAERWSVHGQGLGVAGAAFGGVGGITLDRMAEVAEVEADLIGAASEWPGFEKSGAVGIAT